MFRCVVCSLGSVFSSFGGSVVRLLLVSIRLVVFDGKVVGSEVYVNLWCL